MQYNIHMLQKCHRKYIVRVSSENIIFVRLLLDIKLIILFEGRIFLCLTLDRWDKARPSVMPLGVGRHTWVNCLMGNTSIFTFSEQESNILTFCVYSKLLIKNIYIRFNYLFFFPLCTPNQT